MKSGYIFAGGKSRRMGSNKALMEFRGKTFIENAFEMLCSCGLAEVKIVVKTQGQAQEIMKALPMATFIYDLYDRGAPGALHAALRDCRNEWLFAFACDMPLISPEIIKSIESMVDGKWDAILPVGPGDTIQSLCAFYRKDACLRALESIFYNDPLASIRDMLPEINPKMVRIMELGDETMPAKFANINFPADLSEIRHS